MRWLIDLRRLSDGHSVSILFYDDEKNEMMVGYDSSFYPYFYVEDENGETTKQTFHGQTLRLSKVVVERSEEVPIVSKMYPTHYEDDILYVFRYMLDKDLSFFNFDVKDVSTSVMNIEKLIKSLKICCIDFEWDINGHIFGYSLKSDDEEIVAVGNEKEIIKDVMKRMMKYDIIFGYGVWEFDLTRLKEAYERHNLDTSPFRIFSDLEGKFYTSLTRRFVIDFLPLIKNKVLTIQNFPNYKLTTVVKEMYKVSTDEEYEKMKMYRDKLLDYDVVKLKMYMLKDIRLTWHFKDLIFPTCVMMGLYNVPIDRLVAPITLRVEPFLMKQMKNYNFVIPKRKTITYDEYYGGLVINPQPYVGYVYKIDVKSMYPTILSRFNISPETIDCSHDDCRSFVIPLKDGKEKVVKVCNKRRGFLCETVEKLIQLSELIKPLKVKGKDYEMIYDSFKALRNVVAYGYSVAKRNRFGVPNMALIITFLGRKILEHIIRMFDENFDFEKLVGNNVIYGHTDSVFVRNVDESKVYEVVDALKDVGINCDVEYGTLYIGHRKNRYMFIPQEGLPDIIGFNFVRADAPRMIKELPLVDEILKIKTPDDVYNWLDTLKRRINLLIDLINDDKLSIEYYTISKTYHEDVQVMTPQRKVVDLMRSLGMNVSDGEKVEYVFVVKKGGRKKDKTVCIPDEEVMKKMGYVIDKEHYIKLLKSILDDVILFD